MPAAPERFLFTLFRLRVAILLLWTLLQKIRTRKTFLGFPILRLYRAKTLAGSGENRLKAEGDSKT
jgi:hypothetical protein